MMKEQELDSMITSLIGEVAEWLGCKPTVESIKTRIYKDTDCGAWIEIDERGIRVGSIVEGSDACAAVQELPLGVWEDLPEEPREGVGKWLDEALADVEADVAAICAAERGSDNDPE